MDLRLSSTGWLAIGDALGWRLVDLRDPNRVVGPIPNMSGARGGGFWTHDGRLAQWLESGFMRLTNSGCAGDDDDAAGVSAHV